MITNYPQQGNIPQGGIIGAIDNENFGRFFRFYPNFMGRIFIYSFASKNTQTCSRSFFKNSRS